MFRSCTSLETGGIKLNCFGAICSIAAFLLLTTGSASAQAPATLTLDVSTFAGGQPAESAIAATEDADGNLVVVGSSLQLELHGTRRAYDSDVFVARYSPEGALLGVSLLGGEGWDEPTSVAVDDHGDIVVAGHTTSGALVLDPRVPDAVQPASDVDGFVVVLDGEAGEMLASTFVGGNGDDRITGLAVDSGGGIHVAGTSGSSERLALDIGVNEPHGRDDGFVASLRRTAGNEALEVSYLAYVGGDADDALNAIGVYERAPDDPRYPGTLVVAAGMTQSTGESLRAAFDDDAVDGERRGLRDTLIAVLQVDPDAPDAVRPLQVSVYGSSGDDTANAIAVDSATGDVFVVGRVVDMEGQLSAQQRSNDYEPLPTWHPHGDSPLRTSAGVQHAFQGGDSDGFLLRLAHVTDGDAEHWSRWLSTYIGGDGDDNLTSVAFDGTWIHVAGRTGSNPCQSAPSASQCDRDVDGAFIGLPVVNAPRDLRRDKSNNDGIANGYYARIEQPHRTGLFGLAADIRVETATYLGGDRGDEVNSVVATRKSVWLVGQTVSESGDTFPVRADNAAQPTPGADNDHFLQEDTGGIGLEADAFVVRLSDRSATPVSDTSPGTFGLDFSTYTGGDYFQTVAASAVDPHENLIVVGRVVDREGRFPEADRSTSYAPLPTSQWGLDIGIQDAYQGGRSDGFLLRLRSGSILIGGNEIAIGYWSPSLSTCPGGAGDDDLSRSHSTAPGST